MCVFLVIFIKQCYFRVLCGICKSKRDWENENGNRTAGNRHVSGVCMARRERKNYNSGFAARHAAVRHEAPTYRRSALFYYFLNLQQANTQTETQTTTINVDSTLIIFRNDLAFNNIKKIHSKNRLKYNIFCSICVCFDFCYHIIGIIGMLVQPKII